MGDAGSTRLRSAIGRDVTGKMVYIDMDESGRVVLTTEDGKRATNKIVIGPEVLRNILRWLGW